MPKINRFGGLNLRDDPNDVGWGGAVDLLNVDFSSIGRVRARLGLARFDTSGGSGVYSHLIPWNSQTQPAIFLTRRSGVTTTLDFIDNDTAITNLGTLSVGATTAPTVSSYAAYGTPTSELMFIASTETAVPELLRKADTGSVANSVGSPGFVAVSPNSNRLAQAYFSGAATTPTGVNGSTSTVYFSDPGLPETFAANNYVHLDPGDGEVICGMVRWRDLLFVAKRTGLYVFTSESTGAAGTPIFNYHRVSIPAAVHVNGTTPRSVMVAGADGVYILTSQGIYRTTGDVPELVSRDVTPIFDGTASTSLAWNHVASPTGYGCSLQAAEDLIVFRYTTSAAGFRALAYDTRTATFTVWQFPGGLGAMASWEPNTSGIPALFVVTEDTHIYKMTVGQTTDDGAAITSHYQSGWSDVEGGLNGEADMVEAEAYGTGSPTLSILTDYASSDALAAALSLGAGPNPSRGLDRNSRRGRQFSYKFSSSSGAWSVNDLDLRF